MKVDKILEYARMGAGSWLGRDLFRDNHLAYADWWHGVTGQDCRKKQARDWQKAFSEWQDERLTVPQLQAAYEMDIGWRKVFTSPNQITPKALALSFATYTVEARDPEQVYYPFKDRLVVNTAGKFRYPMELKPNFGSMSVTSDPAGATVVRDGMRVGQTPYALDRARAGEYRFVIQKELFESRALILVVEEGKTATASVTLEPAFVWLSVSEANGLAASLYLDGKLMGRLPWRGQVPFRDFDLRVSPEDSRYQEHVERISTRKRGETIERPLTLGGRYGSVLVNTDPYLEGTVFVDGKQVGTSRTTSSFWWVSTRFWFVARKTGGCSRGRRPSRSGRSRSFRSR